MAQPIRLTHRGQQYLVNPEQIVFVEASGSGASNVYFTNREYRQFEESVNQVETLWSGTTTSEVKPDLPASKRPTKPDTPPETK